ncbi:MAG: S1C family serine protease [Paludibacteraceae bacterium]
MKRICIIICLLSLVACSPQPANSSKEARPRSSIETQRGTRTKSQSSKKSSKSKKYSAEDIYKKCNPAVFTIITENDIYQSQGSGFFISPTGLAVSNYHVFKGTYKGAEIIYTASETQYKVREVLHYSEEHDFILFRVDVGNKKVPYLKVTKREPVIGSKIYAIGSPKGLTNTLSSGEISQLRGDYFIQINAPIDHGSSGGALINEYAEVIGITSGGRDDSGANLNYAIDIRVVRPYIPTSK